MLQAKSPTSGDKPATIKSGKLRLPKYLQAKRSTDEVVLPTKSFYRRSRSKKIPQDLLGNIAILKFPRKTLWIIKKLKARKFLKTHKSVTTILEKTEKIKGKLRTQKTKHLAGIKTKTATYKENNCIFKFDVDKSYFSPRLSSERKKTAEEISNLITNALTHSRTNTLQKTFNILIMFSGIAPYPIVIAKHLLQNKIANFHIYANEINTQANKEAEQNIKLNKLQNYITLIPGDAKKLPTALKHQRTNALMHSKLHQIKFDVILMPRPNLKETFLSTALKLSKKNTIIFYHGFGKKQKVLNEIQINLLKAKRSNIKIQIRKAGDIKPYEYRWLAKFKIK